MARIQDVARLAGVSATTAKRAIREPSLLASETLARVNRAIEQLDYEPHRVASALRGGQARTVGLMVGDILEPAFARLTRTIGSDVRARGYGLLLADNEYDARVELHNLRVFYGNRVSGIIIRTSYAPTNYGYLERLRERGTAIVEIDYIHEDTPFSYVLLENEEAAFEGMRHLVELGHRRIACVGMASKPGRPEERHSGFVKAARRLELTLPPAYVRAMERYGEDEAYEHTRRLLALPEPPTAVFAFNGTCTVASLRAIREAGLAIPRDVSLLGFDNYSWSGLVDPPLDVIEQPFDDMGRAAVETLMTAIAAGDDDRVVRRRFPGRLVRRGSCAPPPKVARP